MDTVVIFDMDGTLIDSGTDITISINHVRTSKGLAPLEVAQVVAAINSQDVSLARYFYGTERYESGDRERFEMHYHEQCIRSTTLYDGVRELINTLKERSVALAVATNAPTRFARRMLGHLEIATYFDHIIGPDISGKPKPEPDMLHYILRHYPQGIRTWMVGDNLKDIQAAKNAGIPGVFVTWGFADTVPDAPYHITTPAQLLNLL